MSDDELGGNDGEDLWAGRASFSHPGLGAPPPPPPPPRRRRPPAARNSAAADYLRATLKARGGGDARPQTASRDVPAGGLRRGSESGGLEVGGGTDSDSSGDTGRRTGLGAGRGGGFGARGDVEVDDDDEESDRMEEWEVDDGDGHALPAAFGGGAATRRKRQRRDDDNDNRGDDDMRGLRMAALAKDVDVETGVWERHTKGVGSKLLARMGFTGRLGLREDGIAKPLTGRVRPEKLGLGAGGFAEKTEGDIIAEQVRERNLKSGRGPGDGDGEEASDCGSGEALVERRRWEKFGVRGRRQRGGKRDHGARLQLVDLESLADKREGDADAVHAGVGASRPVLSAAEALFRDENDVGGESEAPFDAPEGVFNLKVLLDEAEADLVECERRRATEDLLRAGMDAERVRAGEAMLQAREDLVGTEALQRALATFLAGAAKVEEEQIGEGGDCSDGIVRAVKVFADAQCVRRELALRPQDPSGIREAAFAIVEAHAVPIAAKAVSAAVSASVRFEFGAVASVVRDLLVAALPLLGVRDTGELYMRLASRVLINPLRRGIGGARWDARQPDAMVDFVDVVKTCLPATLAAILADEIVVPRLLREVEGWSYFSPRDAAAPPHSWIFPWLPVLGKRSLGPVLSSARRKLVDTLRLWNRRSAGSTRVEASAAGSHDAIAGLVRPWRDLTSKGKIDSTLQRYVVPVLEKSFASDFVANLHLYLRGIADVGDEMIDSRRVLQPVEDMLPWKDIIDDTVLSSVLVMAMFSRLVNPLQKHLFGKEITSNDLPSSASLAADWYENIRDAIPLELRICARPGLATLLFLMHAASQASDELTRKALLHADAAVLLGNMSFAPAAKRPNQAERQTPILPGNSHAAGRRASLKDVVRAEAARNGVAFYDDGRVTQDGQRVYAFGKAYIVLDGAKQVVLADTGSGDAGIESRLQAVDIETLINLGRG
jgi:tuftelin-interacting protein 11